MIWGQIPMRENVPFRDTVRDWYTGLISKRMLGSLELQDKKINLKKTASARLLPLQTRAAPRTAASSQNASLPILQIPLLAIGNKMGACECPQGTPGGCKMRCFVIRRLEYTVGIGERSR